MDNIQKDLLLADEAILVQASQGKRFINYLVDIICFYLFMFFVGIVIAIISPSALGWLDSDDPAHNLVDRLVSLVLYGLFTGAIEAVTKGRSIGKLITGTLAVNEDGSTISTKTAFLRGLCRAVPFDGFSAFGTPSYPWHDRWTRSYVIDKSQSTLI
jgi:uncharacterized RDD family membrane protein YckC